ncbi:hypothetical protein ASG22_07190 [Chryseobacterium sp. Leaf405]|uniref:hypothetical protein n=1 Tax=Chryseobacterium sp. Leaf405 TaxID=1736367 RepID=UPI0006FDF721|nr:hypothetical protein [Chryseobacterium sp. Leaf405]KQT23806.1 hypothetical protein ASG22_07190 [Chryseobacterium sp. Leaf405]
MGELHGVTQLKPRVILGGAILQVKKEKEKEFLEKYADERIHTSEWGIFNNTFAVISDDGILERCAMYYEDKIINFKKPGIYIQIQGQSKSGPGGNDYIDFMSNLSIYLEDALFCVYYFDNIDEYEIKEGVLNYQYKGKFHYFEDYLLSDYASSPKIIADYYAEEIYEFQLRYEELIRMEDDPKERYDSEDYEELLDKLNNYKDFLPVDKAEECVSWLKEQVASYQ